MCSLSSDAEMCRPPLRSRIRRISQRIRKDSVCMQKHDAMYCYAPDDRFLCSSYHNLRGTQYGVEDPATEPRFAGIKLVVDERHPGATNIRHEIGKKGGYDFLELGLGVEVGVVVEVEVEVAFLSRPQAPSASPPVHNSSGLSRTHTTN